MEIMYTKFPILATGGVIGNSLFFFCSGFTLFLGRMGRFDNWYKNRINRVYPAVFIWSFIQTLFGIQSLNLIEIICSFGYWFIPCIMLHYIVLYIIRRYLINQTKYVFVLFCIATVLVYFFKDRPYYYMWNEDSDLIFRFFLFFIITLFGAMIGTRKIEYRKSDIIMFIIFFIIYHITMIMAQFYSHIINRLQIICVLPLVFIVYYFYKICNLKFMQNLYATKIIGNIMRIISMLTLEIYLVQGLFIGQIIKDKLNMLFPINLIISFIIITFAAYILKILTKFISLKLNSINSNIKEILKV